MKTIDGWERDLGRVAPGSPLHVALAEVVRLRQAMARLRGSWAAPDDPADDYGRGMESAYQIAADALAHILEGDNHE